MNIASQLELITETHPAKPAFILFSPHNKRWDTVTFKQLSDSTDRLACGLQACRAETGMRAALMTPPSADFFALVFALLKLGLVPIVIDPAIGLKNITACIKESKPDIFIGNTITHFLRHIYGWGKATIKINTSIPSLLLVTDHSSLITDHFSLTTDSSPAAIIYTSGSTGLPKGALYTHANFAAQLDMLVDTFHISQDEIDLPAFPLYALIDALLGVTSVIPDITFPVPGKTNPEKVIDAIQRFNVTNMFASPVVLDILGKFWVTGASSRNYQRQVIGLQKLPSLKRVITAGAPAPIQVQKKFRKLLSDDTQLFGIYGATETLPIAIVESREIFDDAQHKSAQGAGVCLGRPVKGAQVRIIQITDTPIKNWDKDLELSANQVGEITVKGKAVTQAYIGRAETNKLAKIKDGDDVVHRMGDVGYFDEQGRLWYCGRKSHRVATNEGVLFTEQIEGIFNAHPLVYRTALVGVNRQPVLCVELEKKVRVNKDKIKSELIELAKEHTQTSKIKAFLFMKKFPTDVRHNSKIIREQLAVIAQRTIL